MIKTVTLIIVLALLSFLPKPDKTAPGETSQNKTYNGPIIDMHIHANS